MTKTFFEYPLPLQANLQPVRYDADDADNIPCPKPTDQSLKKDAGKDQWELLPLTCLEGIVKVLTFGARKYHPNGWKELVKTDAGVQRVHGSLRRHQLAIEKFGLTSLDLNKDGETDIDHSGLPHIDHLQCNLLFLKYGQLWEEGLIE